MSPRDMCSCVVLGLATIGGTAPASGQTISPPARSAVEPERVVTGRAPAVNSLVLTGNVTGGHDSGDVAGVTGATGGDVQTGAFNTFGDLGLAYSRSQGSSRLNLEGRGYVNAYPDSNIDPGLGAHITLGGETAVGRTRFGANTNARYEPFYNLGGFNLVRGDEGGIPSPESSPVNGLVVEQHTWTTTTTADVSRAWNRRQISSVTYSFQNDDRRGSLGNDVTTQAAQVNHQVTVGRSGQLEGGYTYSTSDLTDVLNPQRSGHFSTHGGEFRAGIERRLSRTRRIGLSAGAGTQLVRVDEASGLRTEYWMPTVQGAVRLDVGRAWAVTGDYSHAASTLGGVTQEVLSTDTATFGAGGPLGVKTNLAVSGAWSSGASGTGDDPGVFTMYSLTTQLSFVLSRCCSTVVNYTLYDYQYSGFADAPRAIPSNFTRGAIRAGMSVSFPIIRRSDSASPRPPGRS
jgi:hypothetical protein